MYVELIAAGILVADYVYHRWIEDHSPPPNPGQTIKVPTSQKGACVPLFYGLTLIRSPVIAWTGHPIIVDGASVGTPNSPYVYGLDIHLIAGIFCQGGSATFVALWIADAELGIAPFSSGPPLQLFSDNGLIGGDTGYIGGLIEVWPGDPAQDVMSAGLLGFRMALTGISGSVIPGYRGMLSIFLTGNADAAWFVGGNPQPGNYAIEARSLPAGFGSGLIDGNDLNPVDVIYDLLVGTYGKLGLPLTKIDTPSFVACATTLAGEHHGFSRSWEDGGTAADRINEVLKQIDGVLFEDATSGLLKLKLIRADYDYDTLPHITPDNCQELQNAAAGGWVGVTNNVYVNFTDRANGYRIGQARAQNQANAVGQSGEVYEITLDMLGIHTQATADSVAARELQARSQPLMKCRAMVNSSFWRLNPGDPVKVTWPDANVSGVVFRVAVPNRGTLENGTIAIDLIEDYFYLHRGEPSSFVETVHLGAHGGH